jgi:diguanylate cyclase (GGDEF)-like protein
VSSDTESPPDASSVLRLLSAALETVGGGDLTIYLGELAATPGGAPIVDAEGRVVGRVTDDISSRNGGELMAALVASYGYVLEAERAVRRLAGQVEDLERVAYRDPLTGLLNRRAWQEAVLREEARCARNPRPVAVVVVDLDGLKRLNDEHGHRSGDVLLRLTGGLLKELLRPSDIIARIGGDEFAALLVDVADQHPEAIADRLQHDLAVEGVRASVGVALRADGDRLEAAFQAADDTMYRRKGTGRSAPT